MIRCVAAGIAIGVLAPAVASADTTVPEPVPADASINELGAIAESIFGPSDDVVAELARFVSVPEQIPTPTSATITDASLGIYPYSINGYYSASVTFTSDSSTADIVTFYETTLAAAGFVQLGDTVRDTSFGTEWTLRFDLPDSTYDYAELTVIVSDNDPDIGDDTRLEFTGAAGPDALAPFVGWTGELPLVDGGKPTNSFFLISSLIVPTMGVSLDIDYPQVSADELQSQFEAALPAGGFALETTDGDSTTLSSSRMSYLTVDFNEGYPVGASAGILGGIELDP